MRPPLSTSLERIASHCWRSAIVASRTLLLLGGAFLLFAWPAWADLELNDTPVYIDENQPGRLVIRPRVTRTSPDEDRPWKWKAAIVPSDPGWRTREKVAKAPIELDVSDPEAVDKLSDGTYEVTVRVFFADKRPCGKCNDTSKATTITLVKPPANTWAVIIGIAKYRTDLKAGDREEGKDRFFALDDLRYSAVDAERLYELLTGVLGIPDTRVVLLTSGGSAKSFDAKPPTEEMIRDTLTEMERGVKVGDTVLVFYSGHGIIGWGSWYLAPVDTKVDERGVPRRGHPISAADFVNLTDFPRARAVAVVLDACFSGLAINSARARVKGVSVDDTKSARGTPFHSERDGRNRVVLTAADANTAAYEIYIDPETRGQKLVRGDSPKDVPGHGLFTFFLFSGFEHQLAEKDVFVDLNGDGRCGPRDACPATVDRQHLAGVQLTLDPMKAFQHASTAMEAFLKKLGEEVEDVDQKPTGFASFTGEPLSIVSRR